MPTTLMPSFKAFKALAGSLKTAAPDMALAFKHLQASASQQDEGAFLVQTQGFLKGLKSRLEAINFAQNPAVSGHLDKLLSTFRDFIKRAEPQLAANITAALTKEGADKKKALLDLLEDQKFAAALAPRLKAFLTPAHLTQQEHTDAIKDRIGESMGELHQRVADQGIYDPEKAPWLYCLKFLFNLVEMVSSPPSRNSVQKDEPHAPKTIRIPMR